MNEKICEFDYKKLLKFHYTLSKLSLEQFKSELVEIISKVIESCCVLVIDNENPVGVSKYEELCCNSLTQKYFLRFHKHDKAFEYMKENVFYLKYHNVITFQNLDGGYKRRNNQYFDFLKDNDIKDEMTLIAVENKYQIKLFRDNSQPYFSERDQSIASYMCNIIQARYQTINENRQIKRQLDLLDKSINNMNFGYLLLDNNFNLLQNNDIALTYGYEITKSYYLEQMLGKLKNIVLTKLKESSLTMNNPIVLSYESYVIEVMKTIHVNEYKEIDNYYTIHIYSKKWMKSNSEKGRNYCRKFNFTNRENDTIELLRLGLSNKEIAERLGISVYTVKEHMKNISRKMDVSNRTAIITKLVM